MKDICCDKYILCLILAYNLRASLTIVKAHEETCFIFINSVLLLS